MQMKTRGFPGPAVIQAANLQTLAQCMCYGLAGCPSPRPPPRVLLPCKIMTAFCKHGNKICPSDRCLNMGDSCLYLNKPKKKIKLEHIGKKVQFEEGSALKS